MVDIILDQIRDEIKSEKYFPILIDESKDVSIQEQLSIVLSYIFNKMMHVEFIGLYVPDAFNAESLAKSIVSNFKDLGLDLNLCVGVPRRCRKLWLAPPLYFTKGARTYSEY